MNPDSPQSPRDELEARLTALLLGELSADEAASLRETIAHDAELKQLHDRLKLALELVRETALAPESEAQARPEPATLAPERRETLLKLFKKPAPKPIIRVSIWRAQSRELTQLAAMIVVLAALTASLMLPSLAKSRSRASLAVEGISFLGMKSSRDDQVEEFQGMRPEPAVRYAMPAKMSERAGESAQPKSGSGSESSKSLGFSTPSYSAAAAPEAAAPASEAMPQVLKGGIETKSRVGITRLNTDASREMNAPTAVSAGRPALQDRELGEIAQRNSTTVALPVAVDDLAAVTGESLPESPRGATVAAGKPAMQAQGRGVDNFYRRFDSVDAIVPKDALPALEKQKADKNGVADALADRFGRFGGQAGGGGMGGGVAGGDRKSNSGPADGKALAELSDNLGFVNGRAEVLKREAKPQVMSGPAPKAAEALGVQNESEVRRKAEASGVNQAEGLVELRKRQMGTSMPATVPATPPWSDAAKSSGHNLNSIVLGDANAPQVLRQSLRNQLTVVEKKSGLELDNKESGRSLVRESLKDGEAKGERAGDLLAPFAPTAPGEPLRQADVAFSLEPQNESKMLADLVADAPVAESEEHNLFLKRFANNQKLPANNNLGMWSITTDDSLLPQPTPTAGGRSFSLNLPTDNASGTERAKERSTSLQRAEGMAAGVELDAIKLDGVAQDFASTEAKQRHWFFEQNKSSGLDAAPAAGSKPGAAGVPAQGLDLKVPERGLSASGSASNFDSGLKTKGAIAGERLGRLARSDSDQLGTVVELEALRLAESSDGRNEKLYKIELPALLSESDKKAESAVTARGRLVRFNEALGGSESAAPKELASLAKKDSKKMSAEKEREVVKAKQVVEEARKSEEVVEQRLKDVEPALKTPAKPAVAAPVPQPEVGVAENAFSTFSLNVSDVSFKLAAASLEKGLMPDVSTLRSEEFINAFDYHDPEPMGNAPVTFAWERARYPFAQDRDLLRFSVKTAASGRQPGRPLNLVLLLDNSGSMERADRVLIRQECLRVLASQLQPEDRVSVVAFARTARLWVDGLPGSKAGELTQRVGGLTPEGGTNLEDAMNLAYQTAKRHFLPKGVNRVVLLTDGAANLGDLDPESLKQKVEAQRKQGVALDCFGIGWDGYNDELLELLSRNGDGRYGFVNTPEAATSEFAAQLAGALNVAASDVKVQVEWNPLRVTAFRQIGYAKHQLKKEQFRDNTVDAAELAAAESGNALYTVQVNPRGEGPLGTVRVRFKIPGTDDYREHEWAVPYQGEAKPLEQSSNALRLAATAAAFSEWLAVSPFAAEVSADQLLGYLSGIPEVYPADPRPKQLEWMIRQVKSLSGR